MTDDVDPRTVAPIVDAIKLMLVGKPPEIQGAVLADLLAIFLAGHRSKLREEIERTKNFIGTGGVVNMSPADHLGLDLTAFRMLEIKNGDWSLIE